MSKPTYLMMIDVRVNYPLDEVRQDANLAALPDDDLRALLAESLIRQVLEVAGEELRRHGQRLKRSIKGGGHKQKTGTDLGEHYVKFHVAFQGDYEGAVAASNRWIERVQTFGGVAEIGHASLRGTDGTNLHLFSEETEAMVESLDEETLAKIDELMDPNRSRDT
jgi:hypothetical protein